MKHLKHLFETQIFGVCTLMAERLGLPLHLVRLFFIYLTFITLISPVVFYLSFAFFMRFKDYFSWRRRTVRDL